MGTTSRITVPDPQKASFSATRIVTSGGLTGSIQNYPRADAGIRWKSGSQATVDLGLAILRLRRKWGGIRFKGARLDWSPQHGRAPAAPREMQVVVSRTRIASAPHANVSARSATAHPPGSTAEAER